MLQIHSLKEILSGKKQVHPVEGLGMQIIGFQGSDLLTDLLPL